MDTQLGSHSGTTPQMSALLFLISFVLNLLKGEHYKPLFNVQVESKSCIIKKKIRMEIYAKRLFSFIPY